MRCFVWRPRCFITNTAIEILAEWNLAIDKNVSRQRTKIDYPFIKAYRVENALVALGETTGKIDSVDVRIYDRDRTICDVAAKYEQDG